MPPSIAVSAVTFDFGNTLVRVDRAGLRSVVETTARVAVEAGRIDDASAFVMAWSEERDRQFRDEVPQLREVDLHQRVARVLARLRGFAPPAGEGGWDDVAARGLSEPAEVDATVETYSRAFVEAMTPLPDVEPVLATLAAAGFSLGILSNWPLALTIDRYVEARGWDRWIPLERVVVSQRVGVIKPHPAIFAAAAAALGAAGPDAIHVGDDWAADVVGGLDAGWHVAYLRGRQGDTPLPTSEPTGDRRPDVEIAALTELLPHLEHARR